MDEERFHNDEGVNSLRRHSDPKHVHLTIVKHPFFPWAHESPREIALRTIKQVPGHLKGPKSHKVHFLMMIELNQKSATGDIQKSPDIWKLTHF